MSAALLSCLAVAVCGAPSSRPSASAALFRAELRCPAYSEALSILARLPFISSSPDVALPRQSLRWALDRQPTRGLLDDDSCLLRGVVDSIHDHILRSMGMAHPSSSLVAPQEQPSLLAAVRYVASFYLGGRSSSLTDTRDSYASLLIRAARALLPVSARCHALMSPSVRSVSGKLNVAFVAALAESSLWPDTSLFDCMCTGFPIVGFCPDSHVPSYRPVDRPVDPPDILSLDNAAWNAALLRRCEAAFSSGTLLHPQPLWDKTMEEVFKRVTEGPFTLDQLDARFGPGLWRAMPRFIVDQEGSCGVLKLRCCDDAAASLHNECTSLGETITCDSADFPARVAAAFADILGLDGDWDMRGGTDDIEMAYRQCACRTPGFTAVSVVDPSTGRAHFFILPGMNFGLKAAVNQFNRVPEFVVWVCRARLGVCTTHYFDDYCVCEPSFARSSGQELLGLVHRLIGMPLSDEKHVPMAISFNFLGVVSSFSSFLSSRVVIMRPKPGRLEAALRTIAAVLAAGFITYAQASSLRGKFQFLLYTVGQGSRAGRAVLWALGLVRRGRRGIPIPAPLLSSLHFLAAVLRFLPPRSISLRSIAQAASRLPVVVWSDAMWERGSRRGGIGFVVWFPPGHPMASPLSGRFVYSTRTGITFDDLPFLTRRESMIGQLELLGAVAPYFSLPAEAFEGCDVIHYIDNTSALYGLAKGYSSIPDSAAIIRAFHVANISLVANVWFNYVATKANVADLPSRGALAEMARALRSFLPSFSLRDDVVELVLPPHPSRPSWAEVVAHLPDHRPSVGLGSSARHSSRAGGKRRRF